MIDVFDAEMDHEQMVRFLKSDDDRAVAVNGFVNQISDWDEVERCWEVYIPHSSTLEIEGDIDAINGIDIYEAFRQWCKLHDVELPHFMTFTEKGLKLTNSI